MGKTNRDYRKKSYLGNKKIRKFADNDSPNPGVKSLLKRITRHSLRGAQNREILAAIETDDYLF